MTELQCIADGCLDQNEINLNNTYTYRILKLSAIQTFPLVISITKIKKI